MKQEVDIARLAALQARLIDNAITITRPGGRIVYCTCSLEPDEGEAQIRCAACPQGDVRLDPILPAEIGDLAEALTVKGELRTRPDQLPHENPRNGRLGRILRRAPRQAMTAGGRAM